MPRSARLTALAALLLAVSPLCLAAAPARTAPLIPPPPPPAVPTGPEIVAADDAAAADFTVFADGSYVVVWQEAGGYVLHAQRFSATDVPVGGEFVVGPVTGPPQHTYWAGWDLVTLYEDVWALAWTERTCFDCPSAVFLSLYDGASTVFQRRLVSAGVGDHFGPVLAAGDAGRFVLAWTEDNAVPPPFPDGSNFSDAYARLYDSAGTAVGDKLKIHQNDTDEQHVTGATFLASGDAGSESLAFVWESYGGESYFYDVYTRLFDGDGVPRGGERRVNGDEGRFVTQYEPAIAATPSGYVVVWTDWYPAPWAHPEASQNGTILARLYTWDGAPASDEFDVSGTDPAGDRRVPAVAAAADGSFTVLWEHGCSLDTCDTHPDSPDGSGTGVFGYSYGPDWQLGNESGVYAVPFTSLGNQTAPVVRAVSPDSYLALWLSREARGGPTRVVLRRLQPPTPQCNGLCLGGDRFEVTVEWKDFQGGSGTGTPVVRDDDWGTFWFFRPSNVELAVKILDGTAINGNFWVFYASLSNVEYTLHVTDRVSGLGRTYTNPAGHFGSRGDTTALPSVPPPLPLPSPPFPVPVARAAPSPAELTLAPCAAGELCLHGDRFAVEIEWQDFFGHSGDGVGAQLSLDSGWFWFFRRGNPEVLVKVLDGRPVNGHFWVFYAALSNVAFTLRVTDRLTDETMTYVNPLGSFASRGDTTAFAGQ